MTSNNPRLYNLLAILVATAALELGASQVHAMGYGYGFGILGGFNYVPSPGDFLNQHSLLNAGRARGPVSNNVYANNPNAFIHRIRDNGFVPHTGIVDRRSPGYQASRLRPQSLSQTSNNRPQPAASSASANAAARGPVVPIGSFFDASRMLVWPSDAPVEGDLITKRDTSDQACLVVSDLVDKHRSAPITTVTYARNRLLEYGQPALQSIRSHSTPRIAENFHQFMLSLYDSLAAAANPTELASATNPTP
ncbi:MAG: hypothetical protein JO114_13185 [Planctomycetaceae bacterium]|nr:hypothetical protein [Planctomycetaceae bacterium]